MESCEKHQQREGYLCLEAPHKGGGKQNGERDSPCFLIPAGASSPQLLGESAEANEIGANVSVLCGYELVVAGTVYRQ